MVSFKLQFQTVHFECECLTDVITFKLWKFAGQWHLTLGNQKLWFPERYGTYFFEDYIGSVAPPFCIHQSWIICKFWLVWWLLFPGIIRRSKWSSTSIQQKNTQELWRSETRCSALSRLELIQILWPWTQIPLNISWQNESEKTAQQSQSHLYMNK